MRLQACLNGGRMQSEHPSIPVSPEALARDARAVKRAGAEGLHIHPRDAQGRESLDAGDVAAALDAIREVTPDLPISVSTGAWIDTGGEARVERIRGWTSFPDFASVNVAEPESEALMALLWTRGIGVEAGLWTLQDARRFLGSRMPRYSRRVLVEMTSPNPAWACSEAASVLSELRANDCRLPILLHGEGSSVWPLVKMAAALGLATRVGFEDSLTLPGGAIAVNNAALIATAARIIEDAPLG